MSTQKRRKIPEEVKEFFIYDSVEGTIRWRRRPTRTIHGEVQELTKFNIGDLVGCIRDDKYVVIGFRGHTYFGHRLAWFLHHGVDPGEMEVDHRDGDPSNCRLSNLRIATHTENMTNSKVRKHNSVGLKGVRRERNSQKFTSRITRKGQTLHLGTFDDKESAHAAYISAAKTHHGDFARTK